MVLKKLLSYVFSVSLLLFLTACTGMSRELTADEIQAQLEAYANQLPSTVANSVQLSQTADGYSVDINLTWDKSIPRYSTEKALEKYSRNLSAYISNLAPDVSMASLSWMVPYHSEIEPAMAFSYARADERLEQTDLQDRFTDSTFGADAPANFSTPVQPSQRSNSNTERQSPHHDRSLIQYLNLPRHKSTLLPQTNYPRHKTPPHSIYYGTSKSSGKSSAQSSTTAEQQQGTTAAEITQVQAQADVQQPAAQTSGGGASQQSTAQSIAPTTTNQNPASAAPAQTSSSQSQSSTTPASSSNTSKPVSTSSAGNDLLSDDGTTDIYGRPIYVTKSGECWHYNNNCNQGTYYSPKPGEVKKRDLRPCEKCVF